MVSLRTFIAAVWAGVACCLAGLLAQAALDPFDPGADAAVRALALQRDGRIVVGGVFTKIGGGGNGVTPRSYLARLNPDGSVDPTFNPGADQIVKALAIQPDGKILAGGRFRRIGDQTGATPRANLARLNTDGSLDPSFNPGADNDVDAFVLQPDGKILVVGEFSRLGAGGTGARSRIGRLNADGSLDNTFNPGADDNVFALALQPDGKILVGGAFTTLGGGGTGTTPRKRIGRLNADGSVDARFDPGADDEVYALTLQGDGRILVGGRFTRIGGGSMEPRSRIARLHPDGSVDASFDPGADEQVNVLILQPNGRILVGGFFTALGDGTGSTPRSSIARLTATGALDDTFNPGANDGVVAITIQPDMRILVGGYFTALGGGPGATPRNRIGRLQ